jgi:R3H domain
MQLLFPSTLTARQRAALHKIADQYGLPHGSTGDGVQRRFSFGDPDAGRVEVSYDVHEMPCR